MNLENAPRGSFFAIVLIIAGACLFLDNLGIIPFGNVAAYWPLWLVVWGAFILDKHRSSVGSVWAIALMAAGILLILGNLGILHVNGGIFWPIMLIAFGVNMLLRPAQMGDWGAAFRCKMDARRREGFGDWHASGMRSSSYGNRVNEAVLFSSINRRIETQQFEGGKLSTVFGSIVIDLSGASVSAGQRSVYLKADAVFGGIEIIVPRTWRVDLKGAALFGGCDDQTVPPRPEPGFEPVILTLKGGAVFGGITIRN